MQPGAAVLRWSNVTKSYGKHLLFRHLTGCLSSGQTAVVVGPNGSGKSTFLKIAAGLLAPDAGEIVQRENAAVGYASPSLELYEELTGQENLEFFCSCSGISASRCNDLLAEVGLIRSANRLYGSYSSGMRQRLKLAFAKLKSPMLLILDEPTIALDSEGIAVVDKMIAQHTAAGGATLVATNDPVEAQRWAGIVVDLVK